MRAVEQRTAVLHLERLLRDGRVEQVEAGRYRATGNRLAGTPEARRRAH